MLALRYALLALTLALPVFALAGLGAAMLVEVGVFLIGCGART